MNSGRMIGKIYSERALDTAAVDLSKKHSSGSLTAAETSERMFTLFRDVLEETLERSDDQLEELAFMNLKIAEVITRSELLGKLQTTNELKAVLFELIILVKEQCVGNDRAESLEMMELKLKYNSLRQNYSELKNAVSEARMLVGQSGLMLGQLAYDSGNDQPGRIRKVENLQRQFDVVKRKLAAFESGTSSPAVRKGSQDEFNRNDLVERLQNSLEARKLEVDTLKNELLIQKKKLERTTEDLNQQREQSASEIEMLRSRITQLRQSVANRPTAKPQPTEQDMLAFLLMQSLSLEQLIVHT